MKPCKGEAIDLRYLIKQKNITIQKADKRAMVLILDMHLIWRK